MRRAFANHRTSSPAERAPARLDKILPAEKARVREMRIQLELQQQIEALNEATRVQTLNARIEEQVELMRELGSVPLAERLRSSGGGRNMLNTGQESDIEIAAEVDRFDVVPVLDVTRWSIRAR